MTTAEKFQYLFAGIPDISDDANICTTTGYHKTMWVGGIMQGADAVAKLDAGASLVQLYSGFIYRGPDLVGEVARAIAERKR